MNAIQIFNNPMFGEIRAFNGEGNKILFCLADVCEALGIGNASDVKRRLKASGIQLIDTQGVDIVEGVSISHLGNTSLNFIDEPNLYRCVFQSRKPGAEKFQDWIFEEVIPSIRKNGGYITTQETDTPEVIIARALIVAQEALERHARLLDDAKQQNNILERQTKLLSSQNAELIPKAKYTDEVLQSTSTFTTSQIGQSIGMSAQLLNKKLKLAGVQYKQSGQWILTAKYKDGGYATNRVHHYNKKDGTSGTEQILVWTEKGRLLITHLKNKQVI